MLGVSSADPDCFDSTGLDPLPPEILAASDFFPFKLDYVGETEPWRGLARYLPDYNLALHLIRSYRMNLDRQVHLVLPSQIDDVLLPQFYPRNGVLREEVRKNELDDIAVLFAIFALGCLNDDSLPLFNAEGEAYAGLCRAALSYHDVINYTSLSATQAILVLGSYTKSYGISRLGDGASGWNLMTFGFQLAISVRRL